MNAPSIVDRLERFPAVLNALVKVASAEDARWSPAPENWSILEICWHLHDEEHEDFRVRLESTLRDPAAAWPALDLDRVSEVRGYRQRELAPAVEGFGAARVRNVAWLRGQLGADFGRAYVHPKVGAIHAGELLGSWAAHDALHLRQIAKRLHGLAARDAGGFGVAYAGQWTA